MSKSIFSLTLVAWLSVVAPSFGGDQKLSVLIIDGQSNHDWRSTTPEMKKILEASGRFTVEVATAPPHPNDPLGKEKYKDNPLQYRKDLAGFKPDFQRYDVVLSNYNGDMWPAETRRGLEEFVEQGKGLVIVHAANHPFADWREFNLMMGMGWREDPNYGACLKVGADGREVRIPKGQGKGATWDPKRPVLVVVRDAEHPITRGMPGQWMHAADEVYHNLRGPIENVHLLATYLSDQKAGGTGEHEPAMWTVTYGQGRVFVTPMGHDLDALRCAGLVTILQRGTEWAATGKVSIPLSDSFPAAAKPLSQ